MKKKVKILIIILILILLLLILRSTYSKYKSEASGDATATLGKWSIKVNDTDITIQNPNNLKEPIRFNITNENINWNNPESNVKENKFAPGMSGEVYIKITPETDTSLKYTFKLDARPLKDNDTNIVITDIKLDNGKKFDNKTFEEINTSGADEYEFTRTKLLTEIQTQDAEGNWVADENRTDTIAISINWNSIDETNPEYNRKDSILGSKAYTDMDIKLPIEIKAIQYTGEQSE